MHEIDAGDCHVKYMDMEDAEYSRENEEAIKYRSLWRAVIMQALLDSISNSGRTEEKLAKTHARSWLCNFSEDFLTICNMAEYSPHYVKKKFLELLDRYSNKSKKNYNSNCGNEQAKKTNSKQCRII